MAGDYDRSWSRQGHGRQKIFGKADVSSILAERESFVGARPRKTEKDYADWLEEKRVARDAAMDRIQKIEDWVETRARGKVHLNAKRKMQRVEYFTKRAGELDPPILPEALSLIQAYKRAVEIPRAPSERAWRALVPKLLKDREAAQAAVHAQRTRAAQEDRDRIEPGGIHPPHEPPCRWWHARTTHRRPHRGPRHRSAPPRLASSRGRRLRAPDAARNPPPFL